MLLQVCFLFGFVAKQVGSLVKIGWGVSLVLGCVQMKGQKPLFCIVHLCNTSLRQFIFRRECCSGLLRWFDSPSWYPGSFSQLPLENPHGTAKFQQFSRVVAQTFILAL